MKRPDPEEPRGSTFLIALLLRAYPKSFRHRFSQGIRYALLREHRQAQKRGRLAVARFWVGTVAWTALDGVAERLRRERRQGGINQGVDNRPTARRQEKGPGMEQLIREVGFAVIRLLKPATAKPSGRSK